MTRIYGIDTSILVRLVTGDPEPDFQRCVNQLCILIEGQDAEMFASNQVIGEAYIVLQHHYGISASDACSGLVDVLTSGMVAPLNGQSIVLALQTSGGPGIFDSVDRGRVLARAPRDAYAGQTDGPPSQCAQIGNRDKDGRMTARLEMLNRPHSGATSPALLLRCVNTFWQSCRAVRPMREFL